MFARFHVAGAEGIEPSARGFGAETGKFHPVSDSDILAHTVPNRMSFKSRVYAVSEPFKTASRASANVNEMITSDTFFEKTPRKC